MELKNKIGQMLMVGFSQSALNTSDVIYDAIANHHLGGVILFEPRNILSPQQVRTLTQTLQSIHETPLFIAIDQEGGAVASLSPKLGFPELEAPEKIAQLDKKDRARAIQTMIDMVLDCGFNINFFPTLDLNVNPLNPIIGSRARSFSENPQWVSQIAQEYLSAFASRGLIGCAKHFPGHGSSTKDSHDGFVDITNTWQITELVPYQQLLNAGVCQMIMTGHLVNANLDAEFPATLSYQSIQSLLREELGFEGVVVCDDLQMKAISDHFSVARSLELAINAGADILMFCNHGDKASHQQPLELVEQIMELVAQNKVSKERIEQSYQRILNLKQWLPKP